MASGKSFCPQQARLAGPRITELRGGWKGDNGRVGRSWKQPSASRRTQAVGEGSHQERFPCLVATYSVVTWVSPVLAAAHMHKRHISAPIPALSDCVSKQQ